MFVISFLKRYFFLILISLVLTTRFLYLDFGLPLVFQADEVEMVEYSLKYSVNIRKIFEGDFYFFKPFSFVYGSLPAYFNTILLVPFLKFTSVFDLSQDRFFIYLYLRSIYALLSIFACIGVYFLALELAKNNKKIAYIAALLFSLNYYFYWLSKYLNNDVLVVLFTVYFLLFYLKFKREGNEKYFYLAMLFLGFGIATKVTFAIGAIYPILDFLLKKNFKKIFISIGILFLVYLLTNPFTLIYPNEFIQRILEMRIKENGIVIDSYNTSYFKYLFSLTYLITIPVTIFALFYISKKLIKKELDITIFISLFYIIFFSFSSRLVDRWLMPIFPLLIIYALIFLDSLKLKYLKTLIVIAIFIEVVFKFLLTNLELTYNANLLNAFYTFRNAHSNEFKNVYVLTERGLNPFNSLKRTNLGIDSQQFVPYVSENAFGIPPLDVNLYDYVVYSSKVRSYFLNPYIYNLDSSFVDTWENSYKTLNSEDFELLYSFETPFDSIINQENIYIYRKK